MINKYLNKTISSYSLAYFRIGFGLLMLFSIIRFVSFGWVDKLYINPEFHFTYAGFEWIKPLGEFTYLLFAICGIATLFVAIGFQYRLAIITFFLSFVYIELMDKTTYLNHYYFISIVSFVMIFLPANSAYSVDAYRKPRLNDDRIPAWCVDSLKLIVALVYFYAGLAKLNSDWLLNAYPLKIWLPMNAGMPLVGNFFRESWLHYSMSWAGALFDLSIPFLLLYRRTRSVAFIVVIIFHIITKILFPIGVFPYVMILSASIFFSATWHEKVLLLITYPFKKVLSKRNDELSNISCPDSHRDSGLVLPKWRVVILGIVLATQVILPFRYLLYPGELFWTEEGYRFSWRVMLMEKSGYAQFIVTDSESGKQVFVENNKFLTPFQEKQMSFQPDFILEYAQFLHKHYAQQGFNDPTVKVQSYVSLNGRLSRPFIDPNVNLALVDRSWKHKDWILPFNDEIKGF